MPSSSLLTRVASNLRAARQQRGLTREQLAASTDLDPQMIKRIESGRANPALVVLSRLAAAMALSLSLLVTADGVAETVIVEPAETEAFEADAVADTLTVLRKQRQLSRRAMAQMLDVRIPTLRRYESGESDARIGTLEPLARALNIEPVEIVREVERRHRHSEMMAGGWTSVAEGIEERVITTGTRSELWEWRLAGHARATTQTPTGIAEEIATAIRGDIVINVGGAMVSLHRGESMAMPAASAWEVANRGETTARLLRFQVRI